MQEPPTSAIARIPWGRVTACALLVLAAISASQHPHSFFACFLKLLISPIP